MSTFSKKFQKFLIYFFTGASALVIVLGIHRAKETSALGLKSTPENTSDFSDDLDEQGIVKSANAAESPISPLALLSKTITAQGASYQTPWGNVATRIQVKNGKVVAVEIPELPDSPPSIYAESYLIEQALRSGSSNIQGVSGATITTNAFKSSLESAIASARKQNTGSSAKTATVTTNTSTTQSKSVSQKSPLATTTTPPAYVPPRTTSQPVAQPATTQGTTPSAGVSGTFTGNPFSTKWGNAVASITVTNGRITGVTMPQVPNSPPSIDAEPFLISQALAAGSANIQGVSGATVVSNAFISSLESAIAKANAQAVTQGATTVVTSPTTTTSSINSATTNTQPTKYRKSKRYHDDDEEDDD